MADGAYEPFPAVEAWAAVAFDPALYEEHTALLDAARADATEEARERAVRHAIRYAGTDTGAIEGLYTTDRGFTRTVAIEAAAWEAAANERGPNAAEVIKDQIAAYEWVLDLVTQKVPVTEHVVRELHAMLCRSQELYAVHTSGGRQERPLPKGEYKTFPNNPTSLVTGRVHHYAPPADVPAEMHRLVASMGSPAYESLHPVVQAAYVHYAVAAIHPFADGNGRTARALASVPLYRDQRVPLMIFADHRDEYLDALSSADIGELRTFVRFVEDRVIDAIGLVLATLGAGASADEAASIAALQRATAIAYTKAEATTAAAASRLLYELTEAAFERMQASSLPGGSQFLDASEAELPEPPDGYRGAFTDPPGRVVRLTAEPHGLATADALLRVVVSESSPPHLLATVTALNPVRFALRELLPVVRTTAKVKAAAMADQLIPSLLARLAVTAEERLRELDG